MKKILSLVLALGMIFSLAACSGGSESGGSTAADDGQIYEFKLSIMNADQPFMEDFPLWKKKPAAAFRLPSMI